MHRNPCLGRAPAGSVFDGLVELGQRHGGSLDGPLLEAEGALLPAHELAERHFGDHVREARAGGDQASILETDRAFGSLGAFQFQPARGLRLQVGRDDVFQAHLGEASLQLDVGGLAQRMLNAAQGLRELLVGLHEARDLAARLDEGGTEAQELGHQVKVVLGQIGDQGVRLEVDDAQILARGADGRADGGREVEPNGGGGRGGPASDDQLGLGALEDPGDQLAVEGELAEALALGVDRREPILGAALEDGSFGRPGERHAMLEDDRQGLLHAAGAREGGAEADQGFEAAGALLEAPGAEGQREVGGRGLHQARQGRGVCGRDGGPIDVEDREDLAACDEGGASDRAGALVEEASGVLEAGVLENVRDPDGLLALHDPLRDGAGVRGKLMELAVGIEGDPRPGGVDRDEEAALPGGQIEAGAHDGGDHGLEAAGRLDVLGEARQEVIQGLPAGSLRFPVPAEHEDRSVVRASPIDRPLGQVLGDRRQVFRSGELHDLVFGPVPVNAVRAEEEAIAGFERHVHRIERALRILAEAAHQGMGALLGGRLTHLLEDAGERVIFGQAGELLTAKQIGPRVPDMPEPEAASLDEGQGHGRTQALESRIAQEGGDNLAIGEGEGFGDDLVERSLRLGLEGALQERDQHLAGEVSLARSPDAVRDQVQPPLGVEPDGILVGRSRALQGDGSGCQRRQFSRDYRGFSEHHGPPSRQSSTLKRPSSGLSTMLPCADGLPLGQSFVGQTDGFASACGCCVRQRSCPEATRG
ncbi:hypothetical protein D3C87_791970 [compost metagenome]